MKILERLKSPIVLIQLVTILGTIVVLVLPGYDQPIKEFVGAIAVIINVVAGLNNPLDKEKF